jgi:hypothetical protein
MVLLQKKRKEPTEGAQKVNSNVVNECLMTNCRQLKKKPFTMKAKQRLDAPHIGIGSI